jgi:antitoxin HicB
LIEISSAAISTQEPYMGKRYTVSDGKLMLNLEEAEEGGYIVTSPLNPELITQAETIEEAFANARDAAKALRQSRAKLMRRLLASRTRG